MKICIKTFGCTLNQSDTELMQGLLSVSGHEIVQDFDEAELLIFNTCTVKDSPEKSFYSMLEKVSIAGKIIIVAGCVSQADPYNPKLKNFSIIGVRHLDMVADVVQEAANGRVVKLLSWKKGKRLNLPKIRKNPIVEIIPISSGCLGNCSFCKTKAARGGLMSYAPTDIKQQMQLAINEGVKEIWLTSQDSGAYGLDIKTNLVELLEELVNIPGDYKIRIGMTNPDLAKNMIPGLIKFLNHQRAFKFIHIPVQSGSNATLASMKRGYTKEQFYDLVSNLRKGVHNLTIATDIIAGFPTETIQDHEESKKLISDLKIPIINFTKFYPRPGTLAAKMKLLPTKLVKQRCQELSDLQSKIIDNKNWIGWKGKIVINEAGKNNSVVGRNEYYKPIVVKNAKVKLGKSLNIVVISATQHFLIGEIEN